MPVGFVKIVDIDVSEKAVDAMKNVCTVCSGKLPYWLTTFA